MVLNINPGKIMKKALFKFSFILFFLFSSFACAAEYSGNKSNDSYLQNLIKEVLPKFKQEVFKKDDISLQYTLYKPENINANKKYPLLLFMADTSTVWKNPLIPLQQGYGALVWADTSSQKANPCFVLVPQFSATAIKGNYKLTDEAKIVTDLLQNIIANNSVDPSRIYVTGQSIGGSLAMYYNITKPGIFASALYVDCNWDANGFDKLVQTPFIFVYAVTGSDSLTQIQAIENAARETGKSYTWSEWDAKLPEKVQFELAVTQLDKGQPINLIGLEAGKVLPETGKGDEHTYAFDYVYKLKPLRDWLFKYSLKKN